MHQTVEMYNCWNRMVQEVHSGAAHMDEPESGEALWSDQVGAEGRCTVEK
jgi:hypothetical protein